MAKKRGTPVSSFFGWYGMIAILIAFTGVSFNVIQAHSFAYQILNLTGALGLTWNCFNKKDYPEVALNAVFAAIAVIALLTLL